MKSNSTITNNPQEEKPPIVVSHVGKRFKLYEEKESTLKSTVINLLKKRKLTKHEFWSLKDINFTVKKGETLGIIGPNGSGKSTMLKILAGIIYPTEGTIQTEGRVSTLFELGTGFHPELSGRENVYLNGAILGLSRKQVKEKYDSIVEFAELKDFIEMPLKHYSSGMQMRLAFAIAISINPDILLVDEVLAVGDAAFQTKSYAAFQDFKRKGATIVLVSHDLQSIKVNCDRVLLINKNKQIALGKPIDIITKYQSLVDESEEQHITETDNEVRRSGDGKASVEKVWVEDNKKNRVKAISGKSLTIKMLCKFNVNSENPVFGITLHNQEGKPVFSANTLWKNIPTGSFKPKDEIIISFTVSNFFELGYYGITAAIAYQGATKYYDFQQDCIKLLIQKPMITGNLTNPPHEIKLER